MNSELTAYYETMFVFPQSAAADLNEAVQHIHDLLKRADAELIAMSKWDERRFAYEIDKNKRGVYVLAYFLAPRANMVQFERDGNLSERLLRVLTTRADHLTVDEMRATDAQQALADEAKLKKEQATAAAAAPVAATPAAPVAVVKDTTTETTVKKETTEETSVAPETTTPETTASTEA